MISYALMFNKLSWLYEFQYGEISIATVSINGQSKYA